jgi:BirA family biotin operon repressor/biotin-[acetyl-CoA-carboxylase] ligase
MSDNIIWFETLDSTNSEANRRMEDAEDFTVYAARFQTNGRGQKGNTWESAVGENLTFSILVKPAGLKAEDQFLLSEVAALGVVSYLTSKGLEAKIKWPNDIYVFDNKICGILIEHYLGSDKLSASILGIGLNLNQKKFASAAPNPTSLFLETGKIYKLEDELILLSRFIKRFYNMINQNAYEQMADTINNEYLSRLYRLREFHFYEDAGTNEIFEAQIVGIDQNACLLLERRGGEVESYAFKEIKYVLNH